MANLEHNFLRNIFLSISKGYSVATLNGKLVKVKHFDTEDQAEIDELYTNFYNDAIASGLPTEKERLAALEKQKFWTKIDEDKIYEVETFLAQLNKTLAKINIPSQRDALEKQIQEENEKLNKLKKEKSDFIGQTAEINANKKLNEYFIRNAIRKYENLNEKYYTDEEFDDLEDKDINEMIICFNETVGKINQNTIKKITLQPFFQNFFYLTDSISEFWGKRILDLTIFQSEISYWGRHFKAIIQNSENKIPDEIMQNPDELMRFMNLTSEAQKNLSNAKGEFGASSNPNMTQKDYEKMGIKVENPESIWVRKKHKETGRTSLTNKEQAELRQTGSIKQWDL